MLSFRKVSLSLLAICFILSQSNGMIPDEPCQKSSYPPKDPSLTVPTYQVNLDLDPVDRWKPIVTKYSQPLETMINYMKSFILKFSPKLQLLIDLVDKRLGKLADTLPAPYGDEIKGMSNATGIELGELVFFNIFYELFTICTSIVAQDDQGNMYHARNLDFGLFLGWDVKNDTWMVSELLRPITINVEFIRGGKLLYKAVSFVGFVGLLTAVKPGAFSYTMNERYGINGGYVGLFEWITGVDRKQAWTTLLPRDVFENTPDLDFESAVKIFSTTPLLAPCYYILAGAKPNQGAVVTRDRKTAADIWRMDNDKSWFLAQTNYDHWEKPLFIDDRVTPANTCMNEMGRGNASFKGIFNVLSTRPVLNKLTVYAALIEVKTGKMETYIQYCPTPCWPF